MFKSFLYLHPYAICFFRTDNKKVMSRCKNVKSQLSALNTSLFAWLFFRVSTAIQIQEAMWNILFLW